MYDYAIDFGNSTEDRLLKKIEVEDIKFESAIYKQQIEVNEA